MNNYIEKVTLTPNFITMTAWHQILQHVSNNPHFRNETTLTTCSPMFNVQVAWRNVARKLKKHDKRIIRTAFVTSYAHKYSWVWQQWSYNVTDQYLTWIDPTYDTKRSKFKGQCPICIDAEVFMSVTLEACMGLVGNTLTGRSHTMVSTLRLPGPCHCRSSPSWGRDAGLLISSRDVTNSKCNLHLWQTGKKIIKTNT